MKFSCAVFCGLMLSCVCFRGSHEQVFVNQSPSSITATEGESARISCCWNKTEAKHQPKAAWYKNEERIAGERLNQTSTALNCSVLNISNLTGEDTGDYVCKVIEDIPFLTEYVGIKTSLTVTQIQQNTTQATTHAPTPTVSHSADTKPDQSEHPKEENKSSDPQEKGSLQKVVIIYILRSLPIISLLAAFFYLNRKIKPVTVSKPESGEAPDENGETQRNETEEIQQDENISEQENGRVDTTEVTTEDEKQETDEEEETFFVVDTEQGTLSANAGERTTVVNTEEKTRLTADVDGDTDSVLESIVTALTGSKGCAVQVSNVTSCVSFV